MITASDIEQLVHPIIDAEHLKLCGVKVSGNRTPSIQLFIDQERGFITIDTCAVISRLVQDVLDMQAWSPSDYRLEVSSPGIDRPLYEEWQFKKNVGRTIRYQNGSVNIEGRITMVTTEDKVILETDNGTEVYPMNELRGASVIIEQPKRKKSKRK